MAAKIEKLEAKFSAIQAELKRERSKLSAEKKKRETRQKIILGGRLQSLAKTDDRAAAILSLAMQDLSESERKTFEP